jgi:hypothetical protein
VSLRFQIAVAGAEPMPTIELGGDRLVIGSAADAHVRLPLPARADHVVLENGRDGWRAIARHPIAIDDADVAAGASHPLALPSRLAIGNVAIAIDRGTGTPSLPQRTASLARELVRAVVARAGGAPELVVESGPASGQRRALGGVPSTIVIGRGETADWTIVDPDLSREQCAIDRTWDGVVIADLESKNGTRVGGEDVSRDGRFLGHDDVIAIGRTRIRYVDPAARYLAELAPVAAPAAPRLATARPAPRPARWPFWIAVAIGALAVAGLIWILR